MFTHSFRSKLALLLALALLVSCLPSAALAEAAPAEPDGFAVGDQVNGFTVRELGTFDMVGADTVLLEHDKTGALVMLLLNEDTNRTFDISFVTPTENDRGIPHVFEHSTLDGSKKYPSKSLFFNLTYQTYNTYMNAFTTDVMTSYPVASLSEKQLLSYADYYLDSCFNPMIYEKEDIFREEAWRYSMDSADAPLTIAGTVYSEMQGSATLDSMARLNFAKTMYPGSSRSYLYGGLPSDIPDMTWEDLKAYHTAYYHPSNSMTTLYGAIEEPEAFLALLDTYFSAYEKKEFVHEDAAYTPMTASVEKVFDYPVEQGSNTDGASIIYYGFVCENATQEDLDVLDLLTTMIGASSALTERLYEALPTASVSCYVDTIKPEPSVVFVASGVNEADAPVLKETVLSVLAEIAANGFSKEELEAVMSSLHLETSLLSESSSIGTDLIVNIPYYWAAGLGIHGYEDYLANIDNLMIYAEEGKYAEVINKYLTADNPRTALTITRPMPGLKEQQDAELAEKLAQVKAQMSEEEIGAIVESTAQLAMGSTDDASEYVKQLQAVTVESLPEEYRLYDIKDTTDERGIRHIDAQANVDGVGETYMLLNASAIPQEDIHWFKLFIDVIGEVDTTSHSRSQLMSLIIRYLYNPTVKVAVLENSDGEGFTPYLRATWTATDEDMQPAYDLLYELLFETQFTDAQVIRDLVASTRIAMKQTFDQNSFETQIYRALSTVSPSMAYYDYAVNIPYYQFLAEADTLLESDPDAALAKLQGIQATLKNAYGSIFGFVGNDASAKAHEAAAKTFSDRLTVTETTPAQYNIPLPAASEALVVDSAVNYNMVFASYEQLGLEEYNGALNAVAALITDGLLYPMLRDQYGAYGVIHAADVDGMYIISYRDPNIAETFAVYAMLPALVQQLPMMLDQETLNGYILATYSQFTLSQGELAGGINAIADKISGEDPKRVLQWMRDLKQMKVEDLANYATLYQGLVQNGIMSTSGSQSAIDSMPEGTYEQIIKP